MARCDDGDLYFVGRSAHSVFDLLSGALADTSWRDRPHRLPLSLQGDSATLAPAEVRQLRANLTAEGLSPHALARRRRPVVFVDLVYTGRTYENLFHCLRDWIEDERAQWDVIRRKLRFLGITERENASPKTWRWQQHAEWTAELPPCAIANVSIDPFVWSLFGNREVKTEASFNRLRWADREVAAPLRTEAVRIALAEAVALVETGRAPEIRQRIARIMAAEPAVSERWTRALITELRR